MHLIFLKICLSDSYRQCECILSSLTYIAYRPGNRFEIFALSVYTNVWFVFRITAWWHCQSDKCIFKSPGCVWGSKGVGRLSNCQKLSLSVHRIYHADVICCDIHLLANIATRARMASAKYGRTRAVMSNLQEFVLMDGIVRRNSEVKLSCYGQRNFIRNECVSMHWHVYAMYFYIYHLHHPQSQ